VDRVRAVLKSQWRAYRRRFRGSTNLRANNVGAVVSVGGLGALRYLQQLPLVASQLGRGETARYEALMLVMFLAWMVPVMGESRRSISSRALLHYPLTPGELFSIRVGSVFCSPLSWMIVALSLALAFPVAAAKHPVTGLIGLFMFLLLGFLVSLIVTHLLQGALVRRLALVLLFALSAAGGFLWFGKQTQFATTLRSLLPHQLAVAAAASSAPLTPILALTALVVVFTFVAFWTFTLTLQSQQSRRAQRTALGVTQLPGKFGGLLKKDLRYSIRLLDVYLVLPIVILFNMYLASDPAPFALAFSILVAVLFLPCVSLAFNCFGLDSALGLDRYALFPLSGKEKLFSKNLAFAAMMIVLFATVLPLAFWRLGARVAVLAALEFAGVTLVYLACGNWFSVKQPFKMQFYRFVSGGSIVDAVIGILISTIPAAVTTYLLAIADGGIVWKTAAVTLVSLGFYLFSLSRAARALENQQEEIRRALS
jgi:hypothetical protein